MKRWSILVGLSLAALLPALVPVEQAEARAPQPTRQEHVTNLKQIGLAMHNYHDVYKRLPAGAIYDKDGKALLSWRVLILPFLEQEPLFKQFKLDEPWDSENNKKLLDKMPKVFGAVGAGDDAAKTYYRVFTGMGTVFEGAKGISIQTIADGSSNTIMVVEAADGVPWTRPEELSFNEKGTLPKVGGHGKGGFAVLMCDGSVHHFRQDFDQQQMRYAIMRADGNPIDFSKLEQ